MGVLGRLRISGGGDRVGGDAFTKIENAGGGAGQLACG